MESRFVPVCSPDSGTLVTDVPPTYVYCPVPTNDPNPWITVTASACPWLEETNLPACWELTGGVGTGRLERKVDRRQLGTTTITATAGCSSQTVVLKVEDPEPPVLYCPGDLTFCTDAGRCWAEVDLNAYVSAWDNCGPVTIRFSPWPDAFSKGTNSVTATATDLAGNTTNCTFKVIVNDCEAPSITCSTNIVRCADPSGTNTVTWPNPVATDNCVVTNVVCLPPSGSDFQVGETTVTCTATDSSGNPSQCSFTVTIVQASISGPAPRIPIYGGTNPIQGSSTVTLTPSPLPEGNVTVSLSTIAGSGSATFDDGTASKQITQTTTFNIRGTVNSSVSNNIQIATCTATNSFTVSTWPIQFRNHLLSTNDHFGLTVSMSWQSESGNIADLGNIQLREYVTYPHRGANPPFTVHGADPTITPTPPMPGTCGGSGYQDSHSYQPSWVDFTTGATDYMESAQNYEFHDTVLNTSWSALATFTITRQVSTNAGGTYKFTTTKTGTGGFSASCTETP